MNIGTKWSKLSKPARVGLIFIGVIVVASLLFSLTGNKPKIVANSDVSPTTTNVNTAANDVSGLCKNNGKAVSEAVVKDKPSTFADVEMRKDASAALDEAGVVFEKTGCNSYRKSVAYRISEDAPAAMVIEITREQYNNSKSNLANDELWQEDAMYINSVIKVDSKLNIDRDDLNVYKPADDR